jgi:hypothetical protein
MKAFIEKHMWYLERKVVLPVDCCESDPIAVPGEKSLTSPQVNFQL